MKGIEKGQAMITAALDQSWASNVESYDNLTAEERGQLAFWLTNDSADLNDAPPWVIEWIRSLAATAFMETGLRWSGRPTD